MGTGGIVGTVIGIVIFLVVFFLIIYFVFVKKRNRVKPTKKGYKPTNQNYASPSDDYPKLNDNDQPSEPRSPDYVWSYLLCRLGNIGADECQELVNKYYMFLESSIDKYGEQDESKEFNNPIEAFLFGYKQYNGSLSLLNEEENEEFTFVYNFSVKHNLISIDELQFYQESDNNLYLLLNPNFTAICRGDSKTKDIFPYIDTWHKLKSQNINFSVIYPFINYLVTDEILDFDSSSSESIDFALEKFALKVDLSAPTESNRLIKGIIYSNEFQDALFKIANEWFLTPPSLRKNSLPKIAKIKEDFISAVDKIDVLKDPIVAVEDLETSLKYLQASDANSIIALRYPINSEN